MLGIVHRWNICHGDETILALLRLYLTEHRHARILSGICEYKSPSDVALANFIEASTSKNLLTFLQIAEEPDLQEFEDMLSHVI